MKIAERFDVLIVYSAYAATSALSKKIGNNSPFALSRTQRDLDNSYAYFLKACRQKRLRAAFTTSADITGPGSCRSYWLYEKSGWLKVARPGRSAVIFDKFAPVNLRQKQQRELMFSSGKVRPFNGPRLYQLFFDKHSTYDALTDAAIPTVLVSKTSIRDLRQLLAGHRHPADFTDGYVLKDRFGSVGNHVYQIQSGDTGQIDGILQSNPRIQFILQPLLKFDHEIRLIFMGDKIVQTYIRTAPADGFCCNDHQGGSSVYINESDVPLKVLNMAGDIVGRLPLGDSLYALDFVVSSGGNPYLLEGNTGPGLNWDPAKKIDERKSQELIRIIVAELANRVRKG